MPETCETWLGFVNDYIYSTTRTVQFIRYCLTQWIAKLPGSFEKYPPTKSVLGKRSFIWNKGPVNIRNNRKTVKK